MADAPTPNLHGAVEDFLTSYRAKYRNTGKGGIRSNAPMLAEVTALNAAFRAPPSPPVAAPTEEMVRIGEHRYRDHVNKRKTYKGAMAAAYTAMVLASPQPPRPGTAPLSDEQMEVIDRQLSNAYSAGVNEEDFDMLAAKAAIRQAGHPTAPTPKD